MYCKATNAFEFEGT